MNENTTYTIETAIPLTNNEEKIKTFVYDLDDIALIDYTPTHALITYTTEAKNEIKAKAYITHKLSVHDIEPDYTDVYTLTNPTVWTITIDTTPASHTKLTCNATRTRFTLPLFAKSPSKLVMHLEATTQKQAHARISNLMEMLGTDDVTVSKVVQHV